MTQAPPPAPPGPGQPMRPHRGAMILVFGILGIVICFIFGIVAWVMGNSDLRMMQMGQMDPSGEGLTKAGKICGIIGVVLAIIVIIFYMIMFALGVGLAAAGAGGGGGGP